MQVQLTAAKSAQPTLVQSAAKERCPPFVTIFRDCRIDHNASHASQLSLSSFQISGCSAQGIKRSFGHRQGDALSVIPAFWS